ncbi:MAG TPA: GNAT family N-acetyltransferase [Gaiellaceae bacterium]|jgi:ribosomal protein S18 acetylase RimI-like enzyme
MQTRTELAVELIDPLEHADELREVHRTALGVGAISDEWARRQLPRHTQRDDFVFLVARDDDGISGFAYGYTGEYGQWWTDSVARSLTPEQQAAWVDEPHYEVVELHVRPSRQRRGIGSMLLAHLLTRQPHDRALLSTRAGSTQARRFYAKNGWTELAPVDFGSGFAPYLVLGKLLTSSSLTALNSRADSPAH